MLTKLEKYFTKLFDMEKGELKEGWRESLISFLFIILLFVLTYFALFGWV